jgi:hypothetical protein
MALLVLVKDAKDDHSFPFQALFLPLCNLAPLSFDALVGVWLPKPKFPLRSGGFLL